MVKNKKMSKSSIAIIVLALLLVLSMVMGLTGAWFTNSDKKHSRTISLKFGEVNYSLTVAASVENEGFKTEDNTAGAETGNYTLVAGTVIKTQIVVANQSDIDTYYVVKYGDDFYYIDQTNHKLVKITEVGTGVGKFNIANNKLYGKSNGSGTADHREFETWYKVVEAANGDTSLTGGDDQTARANIFNVSMKADGSDWAALANDQLSEVVLGGNANHQMLVYGDEVDLGRLLVQGTYEVRAIQLANLDAAQAYYALTTGWDATGGNHAIAPATEPEPSNP